jgi:hypothetical protein
MSRQALYTGLGWVSLVKQKKLLANDYQSSHPVTIYVQEQRKKEKKLYQIVEKG